MTEQQARVLIEKIRKELISVGAWCKVSETYKDDTILFTIENASIKVKT